MSQSVWLTGTWLYYASFYIPPEHFLKDITEVKTLILTTSPKKTSYLPAGQRAQSDNEDQYSERHFPANENRHCARPADHLFEGQQHSEYLCLPRGWKGEAWCPSVTSVWAVCVPLVEKICHYTSVFN